MVSETLIVRVEHGPMVTTGQSAQVSHSKIGQNRSLVGHDMRHETLTHPRQIDTTKSFVTIQNFGSVYFLI